MQKVPEVLESWSLWGHKSGAERVFCGACELWGLLSDAPLLWSPFLSSSNIDPLLKGPSLAPNPLYIFHTQLA